MDIKAEPSELAAIVLRWYADEFDDVDIKLLSNWTMNYSGVPGFWDMTPCEVLKLEYKWNHLINGQSVSSGTFTHRIGELKDATFERDGKVLHACDPEFFNELKPLVINSIQLILGNGCSYMMKHLEKGTDSEINGTTVYFTDSSVTTSDQVTTSDPS